MYFVSPWKKSSAQKQSIILSKNQPEWDVDIDEIKKSFGVVMGEEADDETQLESENLKIEFNFEVCQNDGKKTVKDQGYIQ